MTRRTEANRPKDSFTYDGESSNAYYTASLSPHLQGVELVQLWQVFSYTSPKIRNDSHFLTTLDGVQQTQNFFNETLSSENMGNSTSGSNVNLDTSGRIGFAIDHRRDARDFGSSLFYDDGNPFKERAPVETDIVLSMGENLSGSAVHPLLRQIGNSPTYFDGVIEPLSIRRMADLTSPDIKAPINSVKSSFMLDETLADPSLARNKVFVDVRKINDTSDSPFIDINKTIGSINLPQTSSIPAGASRFFIDATGLENSYVSGSIDNGFFSLYTSGIVSGSTTYKPPKVEVIGSNEIYSRRGFDFSQVDNYRYDSIAFAGTNRNNRI